MSETFIFKIHFDKPDFIKIKFYCRKLTKNALFVFEKNAKIFKRKKCCFHSTENFVAHIEAHYVQMSLCCGKLYRSVCQ